MKDQIKPTVENRDEKVALKRPYVAPQTRDFLDSVTVFGTNERGTRRGPPKT